MEAVVTKKRNSIPDDHKLDYDLDIHNNSKKRRTIEVHLRNFKESYELQGLNNPDVSNPSGFHERIDEIDVSGTGVFTAQIKTDDGQKEKIRIRVEEDGLPDPIAMWVSLDHEGELRAEWRIA